jgi:prepilin-type N-terminal cleavage/methylation domain-containing protein
MRRKGFTLIEVLVTLVIVSLMAAGVYGVFLRAVVDTRAVQEIEAAERLGHSILALIERDLKGCFGLPGPGGTLEGVTASAEADALSFLTTTNSHTLEDGKAADVTEVAYHAIADADGGGLYRLYRSETYSTDGVVSRGEGGRLLAEGVRLFEIEYFDGSAWNKGWTGRGLPAAVRVNLVISRDIQWNVSGAAEARDFTFRAICAVPAGSG